VVGESVEAWEVAMSRVKVYICLPLASCELVIVGWESLGAGVVLTYLLLARRAKRGLRHRRRQRVWRAEGVNMQEINVLLVWSSSWCMGVVEF